MKIQIKKTFLLILIFFAVFYDLRQLFLFVLAVFLHELSHILVAKCYKLKISNLTLTPLGMVCKINNVSALPLFKKLLVTSIGVITNLVLFIILHFIKSENIYINYFKNANLVLFIFNSLPIYPLDGSKLYIYIVGYFKGHLTASKQILKIGKIFSIFVITFGLLIIVLYPFNILIYVMGVYMHKKPRNEVYTEMIFDFYKCLDIKHKRKEIFKIKHLMFHKNMTLHDVFTKISLDKYLIVRFFVDDSLFELNETLIFKYIKTFPMSTKLKDFE